MSLARRTPLARSSTPLRRTRIRPISRKRAAARDERAEIREQVFARDRHRCLLSTYGVGPCSGRLTPHHLRKEGQGGPYTVDNLLTLCSIHNDWVEDVPDLAWALGLVVRRGDPPELAAARRLARGITAERRR